jgi:hypothetical protein
MPNTSSSFRIAGAATPGSTGASSDAFGGVLKGGQMPSTMTPPNPQDNFLGLGLKKEDILKMDPTMLLVLGNLAGNLAGRQKEDQYNDPDSLRKVMDVYGAYRAKEAADAQKMKIESQGWQALFDLPKAITAAYASIPAAYATGLSLGNTQPIPRRVSFRA